MVVIDKELAVDKELVDDIMTLADVLPAQLGSSEFIDVDGGQCCCLEYNCKEAYVHWTSGY